MKCRALQVKRKTCHTHSFVKTEENDRFERCQRKMNFCVYWNVVCFFLRWVQHKRLLGSEITWSDCSILQNEICIDNKRLHEMSILCEIRTYYRAILISCEFRTYYKAIFYHYDGRWMMKDKSHKRRLVIKLNNSNFSAHSIENIGNSARSRWYNVIRCSKWMK